MNDIHPDEETFAIRGAIFDHLLEQFSKPDFVCYGKVVVELKAVRSLPDEATAQLLNYLATTKMPFGLLVNFGRPDGVEIKRYVR